MSATDTIANFILLKGLKITKFERKGLSSNMSFSRHSLHLIPRTSFTQIVQKGPLSVQLFFLYRQNILNHNLKMKPPIFHLLFL